MTGLGPRAPADTPESAPSVERGFLARVPMGQWEWSLLTLGVWGRRARATEWQGALALPGTFQAPERVARGQGAGGKERAF